MDTLLQIGLSNALVAAALAIVLLPLARWWRKPALTHAVGVLILIKLLTPPIAFVPLTWGKRASAVSHTSAPRAAHVIAIREDTFESPPTILQGAPPAGASSSFDEASRLTDPPHVAPSRAAEPPPIAASRIFIAPSVLLKHPTTPRLPVPFWTIVRNQWRLAVLTIWITGALFLAATTLVRALKLSRALRQAQAPGPDVRPELQRLCGRLSIRRVPRVQFIAGAAPPMLLALLGRPRIFIPIQLWDRLDRGQREALLLHELAHLRRRDHWVRYLEILATCAYWWNPATWWVRERLRQAEEQCCDAWVVWAMPQASRTYMTTLLDAVEFLCERPRPHVAGFSPRFPATPTLASGMGQFHQLQRRLTMVRDGNIERRLGASGIVTLAALAAMSLPVGARLARGTQETNPPVAPEVPATAASQPGQADRTVDIAPTPEVVPPTPAPFQATDAATEKRIAALQAELAAANANVASLKRELADLRNERRVARATRFQPGAPLLPTPEIPAPPNKTVVTRIDPTLPNLPQNEPGWWEMGNPRAQLGHIMFLYKGKGASGQLVAIDHGSKKVMWTLGVPLNAQSLIQCRDDKTLLIKSADGYTWLVNAEDGRICKSWPPGNNAPAAVPNDGVNPFTAQGAKPAPSYKAEDVKPGSAYKTLPIPTPAPPLDRTEDDRLARMEQSIRALQITVEHLAAQQERQAELQQATQREQEAQHQNGPREQRLNQTTTTERR